MQKDRRKQQMTLTTVTATGVFLCTRSPISAGRVESDRLTFACPCRARSPLGPNRRVRRAISPFAERDQRVFTACDERGRQKSSVPREWPNRTRNEKRAVCCGGCVALGKYWIIIKSNYYFVKRSARGDHARVTRNTHAVCACAASYAFIVINNKHTIVGSTRP